MDFNQNRNVILVNNVPKDPQMALKLWEALLKDQGSKASPELKKYVRELRKYVNHNPKTHTTVKPNYPVVEVKTYRLNGEDIAYSIIALCIGYWFMRYILSHTPTENQDIANVLDVPEATPLKVVHNQIDEENKNCYIEILGIKIKWYETQESFNQNHPK